VTSKLPVELHQLQSIHVVQQVVSNWPHAALQSLHVAQPVTEFTASSTVPLAGASTALDPPT
jgi:hypothetical protein